MLRPWPTSTTLPLSALSLLLACSSAGVEQDTMSTDNNETGGGSTGAPTNDPSGGPTSNQTTDAPTTGNDESNTAPTSTLTEVTSDPVTITGTETGSNTTTGPETTASTGGPDTTDSASGSDTSTSEASTGTTGPLPESCDDGVKNGDETDKDCGGMCSPCPVDNACVLDTDCDSVNCLDEICSEATCDDGKLDGTETDIDCGGDACDVCLDGDSCKQGKDCENAVCTDNICQPAACDDKVKNQDESDIDCGGETCDGCANDKKCVVDDDCANKACDNGVCIAASCDDGKQNGPETGIDCGGPSCAPCQLDHLIINEVDYDNIGDDVDEFIEIYNNTGADVDLADVRLVLVNGSNNNTYLNLSLAAGGILKQGQYLVVASGTVVLPPGTPFVKFASAKDNVQNGSPDGIALVDLGDVKLLDALSYKGSMTMANVTGLGVVSLVEGTVLKTQVGDSNTEVGSLIRFPNGNDKNDANTEWIFSKNPTPGAPNVP